MQKVMIDIEQGYLKGFTKEVPQNLLTDDGEWKDWQKVREWILDHNNGEEFYSFRKWYKL